MPRVAHAPGGSGRWHGWPWEMCSPALGLIPLGFQSPMQGWFLKSGFGTCPGPRMALCGCSFPWFSLVNQPAHSLAFISNGSTSLLLIAFDHQFHYF